MKANSNELELFAALLCQNKTASQFYDRCTPTQKQAIYAQIQHIDTKEQMEAFVTQLPSAAL